MMIMMILYSTTVTTIPPSFSNYVAIIQKQSIKILVGCIFAFKGLGLVWFTVQYCFFSFTLPDDMTVQNLT